MVGIIKEKMRRRRRRDEEIVEAALAAAGAALAISAIKKVFSLIVHRWPSSLAAIANANANPPAHLLFLMLNLVIASILVFSVQIEPRKKEPAATKKRKRDGHDFLDVEKQLVKENKEEDEDEDEELLLLHEEEDVDVDELNRRAEAFIMAFRHQLRLDSFSSTTRPIKIMQFQN